MLANVLQPGPGQSLELHVFAFDSEQEMLIVKAQIEEAIQTGQSEIVLPTGERIGLDPHIQWFLDMLIKASIFLLLFSVIR